MRENTDDQKNSAFGQYLCSESIAITGIKLQGFNHILKYFRQTSKENRAMNGLNFSENVVKEGDIKS